MHLVKGCDGEGSISNIYGRTPDFSILADDNTGVRCNRIDKRTPMEETRTSLLWKLVVETGNHSQLNNLHSSNGS